MISLYEWMWSPFVDFAFMRRALVACWAISLGAGPIGVLLVLRRLSLMGDALSHAILPGAAVGFLVSGFSLASMSLGGVIAGVAVALASGIVTRYTVLKEDASFAAFYLISLASGVLIVTWQGSNLDLIHVLFGAVLTIDSLSLITLAGITTTTLVVLAMIYRPLIMECFDPEFLRMMFGSGMRFHLIFVVLVVLNLIGGFQALGTLLAVGLMTLPAAAARFWSNRVGSLMGTSTLLASLSSYLGLLASFHFDFSAGPAIILTAGAIYLTSVVLGPYGGVLRQWKLKSA